MVSRTAKTVTFTNHRIKKRVRTRTSVERKRKRKLAKLKNILAFATDVIVAILTDGFNTLPFYRYADYLRDINTVKKRVNAEGLYFVVKILPGLSAGMFDTLEGHPASYPGFQIRDHVPVFLGRCMKNAIEGKPEYIKFIYQVSVAFKKLHGQYSKKVIASMWANYCSEDAELRDIDWFSEERLPLLERARHYAKQFFQDFDPHGKDLIPRPGPGATNTPTPYYKRYVPHVIYNRLDKIYPVADWFYHNPWAVCLSARDYLGLPRVEEPRSRYKPVPKTALEARGICMEENEIQWMQQAMRRALTKHINAHPLYHRRITLTDQSNNQWLAFEGSKDRSYATIDLSHASDLNARELVSWIVQDNEDLHDALMALSTRVVMPPKEIGGSDFRIAKFAPMGSAICFPIMSLMFMFIIRAAISLSDLPYPHLSSTNVFVYGDDIVVPSETYTLVCQALELFGFKVNRKKSFVRSWFRESCGVHAYFGMDVTPVFVRKSPQSSSLNSMVSLIETEHQFYEKGYHCTAEVLRGYGSLLWPKHFGRPVYCLPTNDVIGWKRSNANYWASKSSMKVRWNGDYQRYEARVEVVSSKPVECCLVHGSDAILRWITTSPVRRVNSNPGRTETFPSGDEFDSHRCLGDAPREKILAKGRAWIPVESLHL